VRLERARAVELYLASTQEHDRTALARERRFRQAPNGFELLQLIRIAERLPERGGVFVDIGTGRGIAARFAHKLGARSISVDWPVTGGREAIENVRRSGVEGYFCEVGRERVPLEDGAADVVLFADVIEHLPNSPKPVLAEIARLLRPGGVCIATTPNATRLTVRLKMALGYSNWPHVSDYYDSPCHIGHHHEYTPDEFRDVFRLTGFSEEEFLCYEVGLRHWPLASLADLQSRGRTQEGRSPLMIRAGKAAMLVCVQALPRLRSSMLLVARKP
jgi:SAM-dependent methyltransferase